MYINSIMDDCICFQKCCFQCTVRNKSGAISQMKLNVCLHSIIHSLCPLCIKAPRCDYYSAWLQPCVGVDGLAGLMCTWHTNEHSQGTLMWCFALSDKQKSEWHHFFLSLRVKAAWELEPVSFIFRDTFNNPLWHGPCLSKSKLMGKTSNFYLFCMVMLHCWILTLQAIEDQTFLGKYGLQMRLHGYLSN